MKSLYLLIALRNIQRNKVFSFINIFGLALGMACCLLIFLFVQDELQYDQFHSHKDQIYRVVYHASNGYDFARVPPPISPILAESFPEVKYSARAYPTNITVKVPEKGEVGKETTFEEARVFFVDSTFLNILDVNFLEGDPKITLQEPNTALIDKETSIKYFGNESGLGKIIYLKGERPFKIVGVLEDFPQQSHIHFNLLLPYENMFKIEGEAVEKVMRQNLGQNWVISHSHTYVLLKEGEDATKVSEKIETLVESHAPENLRVGQTFSLEPLSAIHLYSDVHLNPEPQGNIRNVYTFSIIAFITLLVACFNFINLSTAQSTRRAREIGVRKVLGAKKKQLFWQFMGESVFICLLAFTVALWLVLMALPFFNDLTIKNFTADNIFSPIVVAGGSFVFIVTSVLGGIYPAVTITRMKMLTTLKGKVSEKVGAKLTLRKVLVTVQFTVSIALISLSTIIYSQIQFLANFPLGFDKELVVNLPIYSQSLNNIFSGIDGAFRSKTTAFETKLLENPHIKNVTLSNGAPGMGSISRMTRVEGKEEETTFVPFMSVDYDFIDTYGLEIIAGRGFNIEAGTDHVSSYIINEEAVKSFGWSQPDSALGKKVNVEGREGLVIGVVKDFYFQSLQAAMSPVTMAVSVGAFNTFSVKLESAGVTEGLRYIETIWGEFFPEKSFEYHFLDASLEERYHAEQRIGRIIGIFALLAIVVSCLGAYGLVMFSAKRREKEIGVRKVLGASLGKLVVLLFSEFTWLYLIAFALAIGPAYYFAGKWLEDFAYRIDINPLLLLGSGLLTLLIVWATISYQSIKTALVNPVEILRDE